MGKALTNSGRQSTLDSMNSLLTLVKFGATSRAWRLFWVLLVLMPILLLPHPALAQTEDKTELTLRLRDQQGTLDNIPASAAKDNRFFLEVSNTGTKPITNIKLSVQ